MRHVYAGRRVLITGHTGFKGGWLARVLDRFEARLTGFALDPVMGGGPGPLPNLPAPFAAEDDVRADLRNPDAVFDTVMRVRPDVVFHLAAQPLVLRSYHDPIETYAVNALGTVHLLDAVRRLAADDPQTPRAVVVVTSDKVYRNLEENRAFVEGDPLGGKDPYSASKACAELIVQSYREGIFAGGPVRLATLRAGNVIGGGDWGENRLIPDLARAAKTVERVTIRNPVATRPWQHVLDPLWGYLQVGARLWEGGTVPATLNFGPSTDAAIPVQDVVESIRALWDGAPDCKFLTPETNEREAKTLRLSADQARSALGWRGRLALADALAWTAEWYRVERTGGDPGDVIAAQIEAYDGMLRGEAP